MENTINKEIKKDKLGFKDLLGYSMGDFGQVATLNIMGSFLVPYYTEVAGLNPLTVSTMFLFLKIWDSINDPLMGGLLDKAFAKSKNPNGKFRPWMLRSAPLIAASAILMFTIPNTLSPTMKLVWAILTYVLYEGTYTMWNIPYGSLISAMAKNPSERANLSTARGFGAKIGTLIPSTLMPFILAKNADNLQFGYLLGVSICAGIGLIGCFTSYKLTRERVILTSQTSNAESVKLTDIFNVFKNNRAFLGISFATFFFVIQQTILGTMNVYYFRENLGALEMLSVSNMFLLPVALITLSIIPIAVKKFGNEKVMLTALIAGACVYLIAFSLPQNVWIYIIANNLGTACLSIMTYLQWGMVAETIDYNQYLTGKRTEGSIYGTFSFIRKTGQALSVSFSAALIGIVGFNKDLASQSIETLEGIRMWTFLTPVVCALGAFVCIKWIWNINSGIREKMNASHESFED